MKSLREWTKSELVRCVGGLSVPSKMPWYAYNLPAQECITGSRLRKVTGSTCAICYALKGRYRFKKVQSALYRRLEAITGPFWADAMAELINRESEDEVETPYFRWHDSGDLQSLDHLVSIVEVCEKTPDVRHWLPTREYGILREFIIDGREIPENLNIRISAHMVDGDAPIIFGMTASTVSTDEPAEGSYPCPSRFQGNSCVDCRACWDKDVPVIDYHAH